MPKFLKLLDSDPKEATRLFWDFVQKQMARMPPRATMALSKEDKEDFVSELFEQFLRHDFKLLRSYSDVGRPFKHWFSVISKLKAIDFLRKRTKESFIMTGISDDSIEGISTTEGSQLEDVQMKETLRAVERVLLTLNPKCQLLLKLAAEEYRAREMVVLCGYGPPTPELMKKVANDLRYCRMLLEKALLREGRELEW